MVKLLDASGTVQATYIYNAWGEVISSTGVYASINPIRYRGYYQDLETGFYYLQSRYYDPVICRFINADSYASTGQGFLGLNMFAYCNNNPVNRIDPTGVFWKEIGDFFKKVGNAIVDFAKSIFGAGSSVVNVYDNGRNTTPAWWPIAVKTGNRETHILSNSGNSDKPISVYAQGRADNPMLSSAGIKINISKFSLKLNLGLDDIGLHASVKNNDKVDEVALIINIKEIKVGVEASTTTISADRSITNYTNMSVNGWVIVALYILATTGTWQPVTGNA